MLKAIQEDIRGYPAWIVGLGFGLVVIGFLLIPVPLTDAASQDATLIGELPEDDASVSATATTEIQWAESGGLMVREYESRLMPVADWAENSEERSVKSVKAFDAEREVFYWKTTVGGGELSTVYWITESGTYVRGEAHTPDHRNNLRKNAETRRQSSDVLIVQEKANSTVMLKGVQTENTQSPGVQNDWFHQGGLKQHGTSIVVGTEPDGELVSAYPTFSVTGNVDDRAGVAYSSQFNARKPVEMSGVEPVYGDDHLPLIAYLLAAEETAEVSYERQSGGKAVPEERPEWVETIQNSHTHNSS